MGIVSATKTNETGAYRVASLSPGAYQINVQAPGFDSTNVFPLGTVRPNIAGDPNLPEGERTLAHWFNTAAFVAPPPFQFR